MDATFRFPSRNLKWSVILLKTTLLVLKWPNRITRFAPGPNTFQFISFIFMTMSKSGSSQLSMSHQNISLPTFLQNLCPAINTCTYAIKSWGGHPLHLLTTRECEGVVGSSPKCLPTSVPILPILHRAILYFLQYIRLFPPIIHLFYLMQCFHPYIYSLVTSDRDYLFTSIYGTPPNLPQYTTKYSVDNLACIISSN